jgi:ATP-binding cassette, subfamily C, bacterial CydD
VLRRALRLPGCRRLAVLAAAAACGSAGVLVIQWALLAEIITALVERRATPDDLVGLLAALLAAWALRAGIAAGRDLLAARASSDVRAELRLRLVDKLLRLGPEAVGREREGELVGTATEAVTRLDALVARFVPSVVTAIIVPGVLIVVVTVLDPGSALILGLTAPLLIIFLWLVGTLAGRSADRQWQTLSRLGALLVDVVRVLPTLVSYGRARVTVRWLGEVSEAYRRTTLRVLRTAFLSGFVLEFGAALCTALVAVTVGVRLFEGRLDLQTGLLVLLLTPEFFAPLRSLGADHHARLESAPALERLFAVLDTPEPPRGHRPVPDGAPRIRLEQVRVDRGGRRVLDGVSLELPAGSRTALIGPSGAGKSTVAHLVLGFLRPTTGSVLVDDVPLDELDPDQWRSRIAYVPERPWIAPGTVADNVRLGRPGADDDAVLDALARAQVLDVVSRLPDTIHQELGEGGARLSGGERLRVALARAFVADPDVVVLDEPTADLDESAESAVVAALEQLTVGRTVLTITHRAAPALGHDQVLYLADGTVHGSRPQPTAVPAVR